MLQPPLKLVQTLRPNIPTGILLATAVSTIVFTATPFLIPVIAEDRAISVGSVGIISTAQLGGFVLASWLAPKWFPPRRRVMAAAIAIGLVANLLSAVSPWFGMLVGAVHAVPAYLIAIRFGVPALRRVARAPLRAPVPHATQARRVRVRSEPVTVSRANRALSTAGR
jgi:predicted MFS family arabinose efflux permease